MNWLFARRMKGSNKLPIWKLLHDLFLFSPLPFFTSATSSPVHRTKNKKPKQEENFHPRNSISKRSNALFFLHFNSEYFFVCIRSEYKEGQEFFNYSDSENDDLIEMEHFVRLVKVCEKLLNLISLLDY